MQQGKVFTCNRGTQRHVVALEHRKSRGDLVREEGNGLQIEKGFVGNENQLGF